MNSMIEAPRDLLCTVIAQAIAQAASPDRGRNRLQWFHVHRVNATFIALFMIYRTNNDRYSISREFIPIPLHILASK